MAKTIVLGRGSNLELSVEAFNLFNDDTIRVDDRTNSITSGIRRFGRQWQLGARFAF